MPTHIFLTNQTSHTEDQCHTHTHKETHKSSTTEMPPTQLFNMQNTPTNKQKLLESFYKAGCKPCLLSYRDCNIQTYTLNTSTYNAQYFLVLVIFSFLSCGLIFMITLNLRIVDINHYIYPSTKAA